MPVVVPCGQVVVVVLVVVLVVVEGVVVEVVVVVGVQSGSPGSPVQVQVPVLHCAMTDLRHMLRALPDKPTHPAAISSEQDLLLHAGGAAVATEETKTPTPSATAANVTTTLLVIVIVEPPARHQFGALSSVSHIFDPLVNRFLDYIECRIECRLPDTSTSPPPFRNESRPRCRGRQPPCRRPPDPGAAHAARRSCA
jgi:hypothetical protein